MRMRQACKYFPFPLQSFTEVTAINTTVRQLNCDGAIHPPIGPLAEPDCTHPTPSEFPNETVSAHDPARQKDVSIRNGERIGFSRSRLAQEISCTAVFRKQPFHFFPNGVAGTCAQQKHGPRLRRFLEGI